MSQKKKPAGTSFLQPEHVPAAVSLSVLHTLGPFQLFINVRGVAACGRRCNNVCVYMKGAVLVCATTLVSAGCPGFNYMQ